jgi:hypothetical protein
LPLSSPSPMAGPWTLPRTSVEQNFGELMDISISSQSIWRRAAASLPSPLAGPRTLSRTYTIRTFAVFLCQ